MPVEPLYPVKLSRKNYPDLSQRTNHYYLEIDQAGCGQAYDAWTLPPYGFGTGLMVDQLLLPGRVV